MKIAIIVIAAVLAIAVGVDIVLRLIARRERSRFDKMTPEERFKYQNEMRKKQL